MRRIGWLVFGLTALSWLAAPSLAARDFPCRSDGATPTRWEQWADLADQRGWSWGVHCDDPGDAACERWAAEVKTKTKTAKTKKKKKTDDGRRGETTDETDASADGGDDDPPASDEDTGTQNGQMTYYWASEPDIGYGSGNLGACDNPLVAFESVAVPKARWEELKGRAVEIEGVCDRCVVDDMCAGPGCKDLDLYVGTDNEGAYDGIVAVRFRVGDRVPDHPCS